MTVALAATFDPRGELPRLRRAYPQLQSVYSAIVISLPPDVAADERAGLEALPDVRLVVNQDWAQGRYAALKAARESDPASVHYADMDRLLRWLETQPEEWRRAVQGVQQADYLLFTRSARAWATHPNALRQTEQVYNAVFSHLLGQPLDLSAGSKGFSQRALDCLLENALPGRALGTDAEWTIILHRAGFKITTMRADGLDWETADRYLDHAADAETQREAAAAYDENARNWAMRVAVANEVIESGLEALHRPLVGGLLRYVEVRRHTMRVKPGQHLSQAGVALARRIGSGIGPFARVITSHIPRAYETAIALGFAVDEQAEALGMMIEGVEAEVGAWDAGFGAFGAAVQRGGLAAQLAAALSGFFRSAAISLAPGESALLITHGGMIEAGAVQCLPDADHASWGRFCDYCEGVRLAFDGERFVDIEILRLDER